MLTDGWDLHSVLPPETVLQAARRSQAIVYWVRPAGAVPGEDRDHRARSSTRSVPLSAWRDEAASVHVFDVLEQVVEQSGGRILVPNSVAEAGDAFAEVLAELRSQYALGYYPDPRRGDGSWREVEVDVERRRVKVRTRGGYLDF